MRKLYFFLKSQLSFRHALRSMLPSSTHSALGSMDITDHFKDDTSSGVANPTVMVRPSKRTISKAVMGRYILSCPSETFIGFKLRYRTKREGIQTGRQAALFSDRVSSPFVKKQTYVALLSLAQFSEEETSTPNSPPNISRNSTGSENTSVRRVFFSAE